MPRGKGSEALRRRRANPWAWVVGFFALLIGLWVVTLILGGEDQLEDPSELTERQGDVPEPVVVPEPADQ